MDFFQPTAQIYGTPTAAGTFTFTIQVNDSYDPPRTTTKEFTLTIAPAPLSITTESLPDGWKNQSYNVTLTATGGTTPYSWSVMSGSLPPGLNLGTNGVISGEPTITGTYNFTVQVSDSSSPPQVDTKALSIRVFNYGLSFLVQPTDSVAGQSISPAVVVTVLDDSGYPIPGYSIKMEIGDNPGDATPFTIYSTTNVDGIARFPILVIDKAGTGYTLKATGTLTGYSTLIAYSIQFNVRNP
jgi:hypothetical protein